MIPQKSINSMELSKIHAMSRMKVLLMIYLLISNRKRHFKVISLKRKEQKNKRI